MAGIGTEARVVSTAVGAIGEAFGKLTPIITPLIGVASAFGVVAKALGQFGERQLAGMHFEAVGGNVEAATEKLEAFSHVSGLDFPELEKGTQRLMEAGLSADDAADMYIRLSKVQLNTGQSAEEMGDIISRVMLKEEVSMKDLNKLAAAGIPGIANIAKEYKGLEVSTQDADRQLERSLVVLKRLHEQTQLNAAATQSFGQSTGLMAEAFKQFQEAGSRSATGARVTEFAGVTQGVSELSQKFGAQFVQGIQQISKETGLSENSLRDFIDAGKLGYGELISAAQRFREEQEKTQEQKIEDTRFKNQNDLIAKQRGLVGEVFNAFQAATDPGGPFANIDKYLNTFIGKVAVFKHNVSEALEAFGKPIADALGPGLDTINTQWDPAMQKVAEKFGKTLVGEADKFWAKMTSGLDDFSPKAAKKLGEVFGKVGENFAKAVAPEDITKPQDWLPNFLRDVQRVLTAISGGPQKGFSTLVQEHKEALEGAGGPATAAPVTPAPQEVAPMTGEQINDALQKFMKDPENQKQTSVLQDINKNLLAVFQIA